MGKEKPLFATKELHTYNGKARHCANRKLNGIFYGKTLRPSNDWNPTGRQNKVRHGRGARWYILIPKMTTLV
jgi:hypothetical protein